MSEDVLNLLKADISEVERFASVFSLSMDKKPADGGWTASQCLAHLADAEISLALRLRMMLTSDGYKFSSWDEDAFAVIKEDRDPRVSIETFKSLRLEISKFCSLWMSRNFQGREHDQMGIKLRLLITYP